MPERGRRSVNASAPFLAVLLLLVRAGLGLAGQDWYLMVPPSERSIDLIEGTVPLHEWTQVGSYDSVSECEAAKVNLADEERKRAKALRRAVWEACRGDKCTPETGLSQEARDLRAKASDASLQNLKLLFGRCVSSDDRRFIPRRQWRPVGSAQDARNVK